jgi:hypothetical protein
MMPTQYDNTHLLVSLCNVVAAFLILIWNNFSYNLKPGTMVEWSNYWGKGIRMRDYKKNTEAFMGTFSQGPLL